MLCFMFVRRGILSLTYYYKGYQAQRGFPRHVYVQYHHTYPLE